MLALYGGCAQKSGAATVLGLLAIEDYQILLGRGTAHLLLNGQNDFFDLAGIDALEQTTKGRLCRNRILALGVGPDTKTPAVRLAHASGKLWQILLPAWSAAECG